MKRERLKELGLTDEQINEVMAEHGKTVEKAKGETSKVVQDLEKYKDEVEGLKTQLTDANTQIDSFKEMDIDSIKQSAEDWRIKHETDTENLKNQLLERDEATNTEAFFKGYKFTSDLAREASISNFKSKGFKYENGTYLGGTEYMEQVKEANPGAFVSDEPTEPMPQIVKPGGGSAPQGEKNPFNFNFMGMKSDSKQ